jgi:hypothetical protein
MVMTSGDVREVRSAHRTVRIVAGALAAVAAALYVVVFFVQLPHMHETDNPAPAYLVLAALYAASAVLIALRDVAVVHWVGAAVQVVLVGMFFWLLAGLYREGDESFILDMAALAIAITAIQVVLLGLLTYLAISAPHQPTAVAPQ